MCEVNVTDVAYVDMLTTDSEMTYHCYGPFK